MKKISKKILDHLGLLYVKKIFIKKPDNLIFVEPTYYIIDSLNNKSIVIDVGTGNNADLSQGLIKRYNLKSYGFDPTKKHYSLLKTVEKESNGNFIFNNFFPYR